MRRILALFLVIALLITLPQVVRSQADEPKGPAVAPATQPGTAPEGAAAPGAAAAPTAPTTQPDISADAQAVLDKIRDAYAKLESLELAGQISMNFDAGGQKQQQNVQFTAAFQAPNKFRHEIPDELILVSTGEKTYVYGVDRKQYLVSDAPKGRVDVDQMPQPIPALLGEQNLSLLLAMSLNAADELTEGSTQVSKSEDVKVGETSFTALKLDKQGAQVQVLVDPQTNLVRSVTIDMKQALSQQGVEQVNVAEVKYDYAKSAANAAVAGETFAWAPPKDATEAKMEAAAPEGAGGDPSQALVGKPAPDFSLDDLQGQKVALADQKGSVVVLDFWATWCPPCRKGLPHLDELARKHAKDGVKVYAVNVQETAEKVKPFMEQNKLSLPVLLDAQGETARKYAVSGIPQTVVIGKDGTVKAVIVGYDDGDTRVDQAVEAALK